MSINRIDYIIVGCNLLSNEKHFEQMYGEDWLDELDSIKELEIVYDCMAGNYLMIGKIVNESEEYEGIDFKKINLDEINNLKNEVKNIINDKFNLHVEPELYVFTHWY